jgi:hypothetical protein
VQNWVLHIIHHGLEEDVFFARLYVGETAVDKKLAGFSHYHPR